MNSAGPKEAHRGSGDSIGVRPLVDSDYRAMIESVEDYGIFMIDINGVIRSWNQGAQRLKGYAASEVVGRHFSMFYPQELVEKQWPQHELDEASRTGRFEDEGWRVRKDGTRFWANIILTRLLDPQGGIRGFSKITRDLTERRKQEESVRTSEERFRLLVDSVQDYAIFMLDPAGYIVSWNRGAEKNKGYKAAEIIGKHFSIFYPEDVARSDFPATELATARSMGQFEDEGWRVRKDGSRFWASVKITAVFDEIGRHRGFAKVTRDMTEARKVSTLEDEGRRVLSYLAMLGHELRNPLAPMANAIALMKTVEMEPGVVRMARDVMDRQLNQMTRMVDDLLDISRITSGKVILEKKPVALREVIERAVEAAQPMIDSNRHELLVRSASEVWVAGDSARLIQVTSNLLNNAAKFTPKGGKLSIELAEVAGVAEIRVKDNGPGIPEEQQAIVFSLFSQGEQGLSRDLGGLGIGLALSRQLTELQQGKLDLYSTGVAGEGCEFIVSLAAIMAPDSQKQRAQTESILVVDDNEDSANTLSMLIRGLGYECHTAYDGETAFEMVLAEAPRLVLLDLGLPGLNGFEVAERIAAEIVMPPMLIAISGYGQDEDKEQTYKAGFQAHLTKPIEFGKMPALLKRLLG
jgi:PAS domain S-box-containing protein